MAVEELVQVVASDRDVAEGIQGLGAEHLQRCYQCGTCSVVCPLTPEEDAFPRKEMVWAQWGLKDRLMSDGDAWLCYSCNDCVTHCPVDARPGDVMAAIRSYQITNYAFPSFLTKAASELKYLPFAFILPILVTAALVVSGVLIPNDGSFVFPEGKVLFAEFIPHTHIDIATLSFIGVVFALAGIGFMRFWRAINDAQATATKKHGFLASLGFAMVEVFSHRSFKACKTSWTRYYAHIGIFYGFIMLIMATTGAFVYTVVLPALGIDYRDGELSLPLYDPVKIIGNVGGILLLVCASQTVFVRLTDREASGASGYFDWFFVAVLYVTAFTGFILQALRFADFRELAYSMYLVHLVFIYMLFLYFPYSKFAHLGYRILALTHARQIGRSPAAEVSVAALAPPIAS